MNKIKKLNTLRNKYIKARKQLIRFNKTIINELHKEDIRETSEFFDCEVTLIDMIENKINIIDNAAIEAAIFIQNPKTTIAIANVVGAVWSTLLIAGISTTLIDNRQWKKIILDKGNATKEDIKTFAVSKWGEKFPEQDYADAACIALWNKRRTDYDG